MARAKLRGKAYITIGNEKVLCYERDIDGNVTWHLPKEEFKKHEEKMLENISKCVNEYVSNNPSSGILTV